MKVRASVIALILLVPMVSLATANGGWLKKVPQADRARTNPYAGDSNAAAAGRNLFQNNCAKCHGESAEGKGSRPSLRTERIQTATDGELAWLLKNGEAYKGMPGWGALPEPERWQIISYLRSLNTPASGAQQ
jgi:mono/diheme cytochrome c family protein